MIIVIMIVIMIIIMIISLPIGRGGSCATGRFLSHSSCSHLKSYVRPSIR